MYFNSMSPAGGIERVISLHCKFLIRKHDVVLLTKDHLNSFYPLSPKIQRESLDIKFLRDMHSRLKRIYVIIVTLPKTIYRLRCQLAKYKPDLIYVASPLNLFEFWLAGAKLNRIMVTEHSSYIAYNRIYRILCRLLYPYVGLLTVPTTLDSWKYKRMGIDNAYLPNPLPFKTQKFSNLDEKRALSIGRLTDDKRFDLLIDIWNMAQLESLDWTLKIIGAGENEALLRGKIAKLGLSKSISIDPPTEKVVDEYVSSSIFLLASRAEGFGLVLLEAMACGVPCIAFNCPSGPRDIIRSGETGILVEEGDIKEYASCLRSLAMDLPQRKIFGASSRVEAKKIDFEVVERKFMLLVDNAFPNENISHASYR